MSVSTPSTATLTATVECPECAVGVALNDVLANEIVQCEDCGVDLEVITLDPPAVELAPEEEEDWGE